MSTTASRRGPEAVVKPWSPNDPPSAPLGDAPAQPAEDLIKEARRRQRRRWALTLLAIAAVIGLIGGLVASIPPPGPTRPASRTARGPLAGPLSNLAHLNASAAPESRCPTGATTTRGTTMPVIQSLHGAFAACLRVANVASGQYHVVLNAAITHGRPGFVRREPRMQLSISPPSGRPGSRVTVTGVVSVAHRLTTAPAPNRTSTATVCWGGCPGGLQDQVDTTRWSSPTTFHVSFTVPAAPWIEVGASGKAHVVAPAPGAYLIGMRCVGPFSYSGCGLGPAEASGTFRIVSGHAHLARCPMPTSCAFLGLGRRSAIPAQAFEVRGVAPLVSMIGTRPDGAELEVLPGPARGPQIVFGLSPGSQYHWVHMGDASLDVKPPPSFASLGRFSVSSETGAGFAPLSGNPAAPERIAHCAPGAAVITTFGADGAVTTMSISTAGAIAALAGIGLSPAQNSTRTGASSTCNAVALPNAGPAVFVAFEVPLVPTGIVARSIGLESLDGGASWSVLPVPVGATVTGFGGFRYQANLVEALYTPAHRNPPGIQPLVEMFDPSSGTWRPASLGCPSNGPCVTVGPLSASNCAGGAHAQQELLRSNDGGASWREPVWPTLVDPCANGAVAAISPSTELLVHGSMRYPYLLLRSTDGGKTWGDVGLPREPSATAPGIATGGLTLLSNGALLALRSGPTAKWELLVPGSQRWCAVQSVPESIRSSARNAGATSVFDGQLWWARVNDAATASLLHVEITDIKCGHRPDNARSRLSYGVVRTPPRPPPRRATTMWQPTGPGRRSVTASPRARTTRGRSHPFETG